MDDVIRLTDLTVRYGRVCALDGLTLRVPRGEIYGFLGRNGAGKTTTLRVLMGIVRPVGGSIEIFGESMRRVSTALKQQIGYVSQEQHFYPWMSARRLGAFAASFYPTWETAEFERLLALFDVPFDQRSIELSGGTRSKLALALALAPRPRLLLLDEPTTGLDPVARQEFNDLVAAVAAGHGTTVFFSSHLVDEVERLATHIGIVQAGRMRIDGGLDELRTRVRRVVQSHRSSAEMNSIGGSDWSAEADSMAAESMIVDDALALAQPFTMPEGFVQVRGDVWQADPERWDAVDWPLDVRIERLALSEIFLAFARTDAVLLGAA